MPATTAQKLKVKEGYALRTLHAPEDFTKELGDLPPDVTISAEATEFDQLHWFVTRKSEVDKEAARVISLLKKGATCWIYFPKGASKMQTDLTRDKGWESLSRFQELQWLSLISFNNTWSAFALRLPTVSGRKKPASSSDATLLTYIDTVQKKVVLPEDLAEALHGAPNEKAFFESLAYSHKKEYVEWIVTAKKEETRKKRVQQTVERLSRGWKNPANR